MNDDAIKQAVISLTAGPVQPYSEVLQALARPVAYDYDPAFMAFYEQVALRCSEAMRWPQPALILQAEPAVAIEAAAASAISPDDVVLNLVSGVYGKGFGYWSARYHKEMFELEVPYNAAINVEAVSAMLTLHPEISVVSVVHHDTPSGTLNPIHEIGAVVRDHGALLIVDAVSSFAGMNVHPADCHADIFITGPGKCLGGTPGVTFMAVSDKAWAHMAANPAAPRASILSLLDWQDAWQRDIPFPFTPS
ncbi:MAG: alanine--glyoxylate aminotransferase family protein, partial [Candidatus Competibacteraceae bacterium]|nr:alanine--glyoxylate aminotransferase family protein [Candidatus Competibacteraceae bacterium]